MFSNYWENALIDHIYRGVALPALPANLFVSLHTADPTDAGTGAETTYAGYARQAVARSLTAFAGTQGAGTTVASTGSSGTTSNNNTITFPNVGAGSVQQTITHWGLWDALTAGNLIASGALTTSRVLSANDAGPTVAAAAMSQRVDS